MNILISPGYFIINAHLRHIAPNHNHCTTSVILPVIPQALIHQKEAKIWIKNPDEQLLIMQAAIEATKKDPDEKMNNLTEDFKEMITSTITSIMGKMNIPKYSPDKNDSPKAEDLTTVVPANGRAPPLDSGNYTKICGM